MAGWEAVNYSRDDVMRMQRDAEQRVKEMQRKAERAIKRGVVPPTNMRPEAKPSEEQKIVDVPHTKSIDNKKPMEQKNVSKPNMPPNTNMGSANFNRQQQARPNNGSMPNSQSSQQQARPNNGPMPNLQSTQQQARPNNDSMPNSQSPQQQARSSNGSMPNSQSPQQQARPNNGPMPNLQSPLKGISNILSNFLGKDTGGLQNIVSGFLKEDRKDTPIGKVMSALNMDSEKLILIFLMLILLNDGADYTLILALGYILL